jgi:NAD(P)-dependent dehydrogenase (short-subunit alcohol dehydrogenase family)
MRLENKVAFVSGGARGMGAAEAKLFAREGAKVVIGDVLDEDGRKTEAEINELGGECLYVHLDVSSEDSWRSAVAETVSKFGKLDILVNNAGVVSMLKLEDIDVNEWDWVMDINAKGVFLGTKAAIPEMRKAGGGSIVNISSISGFVGQDTIHPGYNASKGAVRLVTKAAAVQHAKSGIRVNSVHPGMMPPMLTSFQRGDPNREAMNAMVPMGREGEPIEVANAVLFLASDEASYITGTELLVDGGFTAK